MKHKSMSLTSVVEFIIADEQELDAIKHKFGVFNHLTGWHMSIPWTSERIQTWYGDIAKTILANL